MLAAALRAPLTSDLFENAQFAMRANSGTSAPASWFVDGSIVLTLTPPSRPTPAYAALNESYPNLQVERRITPIAGQPQGLCYAVATTYGFMDVGSTVMTMPSGTGNGPQ